MLKAADYRTLARKSLTGKWWMGVLVCFLGGILGALTMNSPFEITYGNNGQGIIGPLGFKITVWNYTIDPAMLSQGLVGILSMAAIGFAFIGIAQFIIGGAVRLGICSYFSKQALGLEAGVKDEFAYFNYLWKAFGLRFMMALFVFLWSLLLIIPGIIAAYRYSMAEYIMAEHPEMDIFEAIDASKEMMDGNLWRAFCLDISFIGWMILCAFTMGIGNLFLEPYMQMARAHFYLSLTRPMNQSEGYAGETFTA